MLMDMDIKEINRKVDLILKHLGIIDDKNPNITWTVSKSND